MEKAGGGGRWKRPGGRGGREEKILDEEGRVGEGREEFDQKEEEKEEKGEVEGEGKGEGERVGGKRKK